MDCTAFIRVSRNQEFSSVEKDRRDTYGSSDKDLGPRHSYLPPSFVLGCLWHVPCYSHMACQHSSLFRPDPTPTTPTPLLLLCYQADSTRGPWDAGCGTMGGTTPTHTPGGDPPAPVRAGRRGDTPHNGHPLRYPLWGDRRR